MRFGQAEKSSQITQLHSQVSTAELNDAAVELAHDLLYVLPDLAVTLISDLGSGDKDNAYETDLAKVLVRASVSDKLQGKDDVLKRLHTTITNPDLRNIVTVAPAMATALTAERVIECASRLPKTTNRLFLLREWARSHPNDPNAADVLEHAIDEAIRSVDYTPNCRDANELCRLLGAIVDHSRRLAVISKLDGIKNSFEKYGPTIDYIRLQLTIAKSETDCNSSASTDRVLEIYLYITSVLDDTVRVSGLAALLSHISASPLVNDLLSHGLSEVEHDFRELSQTLLKTSAAHDEVFLEPIRFLARTRLDLALELSSELNIEPRRNSAFLQIAKVAGAHLLESGRSSSFQDVLNRITEQRLVDRAVLHTLSRCRKWQFLNDQELSRLEGLVEHIEDGVGRCHGYLRLHEMASKSSVSNASARSGILLARIRESLESIDAAWSRVSLAYNVARELAVRQPEIAKEYVAIAGEIKANNVMAGAQIASWSAASLTD